MVWVFFFYLFCILFTLRSLKIRYVIIFPPIFLSFFFSFFSCCNISGLSEKIWALNVKCSTSFSLLFTSTRLARFASFNVKMFVQKSFCGARSDTWADLYYCITMLHKDITTWHSQYDAVRHLSDLNYIRNTITCANPVILYFHRKEFFCGDFQKKFADETTKALFQNEFYFVFQTIHNLSSPRQVFIQCSLLL